MSSGSGKSEQQSSSSQGVSQDFAGWWGQNYKGTGGGASSTAGNQMIRQNHTGGARSIPEPGSSSGREMTAREKAQMQGGVLGTLLGIAGGTVGMVSGGIAGYQRGGSKFDQKAAEKMGISEKDFSLATKHGLIDKGTGLRSLLSEEDEDEGSLGIGGGGVGESTEGMANEHGGWY